MRFNGVSKAGRWTTMRVYPSGRLAASIASRDLMLERHHVPRRAAELHPDQVNGGTQGAVLVGVGSRFQLRQRRARSGLLHDLELEQVHPGRRPAPPCPLGRGCCGPPTRRSAPRRGTVLDNRPSPGSPDGTLIRTRGQPGSARLDCMELSSSPRFRHQGHNLKLPIGYLTVGRRWAGNRPSPPQARQP